MPENAPTEPSCSGCGGSDEKGHMPGCSVRMEQLQEDVDAAKPAAEEAVAAVEDYAKKEKPPLPDLDF